MEISNEDFKTLKKLEEQLWKAEKRFDQKWMNKILSSSFFEIGRSGRTYTREITISCKPSEIPINFPLIDFKIRLLAQDFALVT